MAMDKSMMSSKGRKLLNEKGFYEVQLPYLINGDGAGGTPYYMTVDFVSQKELDRGERAPFVARNIDNLIEQGFVQSIYGDGPVSSIRDFKEMRKRGSLEIMRRAVEDQARAMR